MKKNGNKTGKIYLGIIFFIMYLPLLVMFFFSFNEANSTSKFTGFSLKWYAEMLRDTAAMEAVKNTFLLAFVCALIATVLGTAAAVGIYGLKNKWFKTGVLTVTNIPMMNPDIVTGVSLMFLFAFIGRMIGAIESLNFVTLLIAHVTFCLPYVVLNVLPKLMQTDKHLAEAAQDLGSTPVHAFFNVVFPSILPGIVSGAMMSFTLSLDDFVISHYTSGSYTTLPLLIYSMTKKRVTPEMYAICSCIFVTVLVLLVMMNISQAKEAKAFSSKESNKTVKIVAVFVAIALVVTGVVAVSKLNGSSGDNIVLEGIYTRDLAGTTLKVYNWGEYISDGGEGTLDVEKTFEELTGINIDYTTFDDNETMYSTLSSGATYYDIIIPSDYMIDRMREEGMLRKLDFEQIPNYKYISEDYKNLYFDENNEYSVPYNVGMVGLIYNKTMVSEAPDSWDIMWDEEYKGNILTFRNPRDAFAISHFMLGQDVNSHDLKDWDKAADLLKKQRPLIQMYVMDEVFNKMETNNAAIAPYYAGDYLSMADVNPELEFVYPKEGTNIFCDSVCIPENSQNYEAALMFINFLLEPEIALANAEYLCYASPNTSVITNDNYSLKDNEILYPSREVIENAQWYHNLPEEVLTYYEGLMIQVQNS